MVTRTAYYIPYYTYVASLLYAIIISFYRFKKIDSASRILVLLICCALINECAAYYLAKKYADNLSLYSIYCFVEFGLICLYFNKIIDVFVKKNIGVYIGVGGILFGVLNLVFIQSLDSLNSYFLFFEGLSVIGMSLFAFFRLLLKHDSLHLYRYHHFWFISCLLFFWSITFLNWGLYDYFNMKFQYEAWKINFALVIVSAITYFGIGCVFLLYPKMQNNYDK